MFKTYGTVQELVLDPYPTCSIAVHHTFIIGSASTVSDDKPSIYSTALYIKLPVSLNKPIILGLHELDDNTFIPRFLSPVKGGKQTCIL